MPIALLETHTLTISIPDNNDFLTADGKYVETTYSTSDIQCNIQPYNKKKEQMPLPEGIRASDVRIVYTASTVMTSEHLNRQDPYITTIDGFEYEAFKVEEWRGYDLPDIEHSKIYFVKRDWSEQP